MTEREAMRNCEVIADGLYEANKKSIMEGWTDAAEYMGIPWNTELETLLIATYKTGVIDMGLFCVRKDEEMQCSPLATTAR